MTNFSLSTLVRYDIYPLSDHFTIIREKHIYATMLAGNLQSKIFFTNFPILFLTVLGRRTS